MPMDEHFKNLRYELLKSHSSVWRWKETFVLELGKRRKQGQRSVPLPGAGCEKLSWKHLRMKMLSEPTFTLTRECGSGLCSSTELISSHCPWGSAEIRFAQPLFFLVEEFLSCPWVTNGEIIALLADSQRMIAWSQRSLEDEQSCTPKIPEASTISSLSSSFPNLSAQSLMFQNESPGISPNLAFKISGNKAFTTSLRETIFQPVVLHSKAFHKDSQFRHALL